jgi:hypothetical protein
VNNKIGLVKIPGSTPCEVVRSFSYKLNTGNYESRDFFCSQKCQCTIETADDVSERLYAFCRSQVLKDVQQYKRDMAAHRMPEQKAS